MKSPYAYCCVSIAPIRLETKDSSEMTSQLLFGEIAEIIEEENQWRKVRNVYDNYSGWLDVKSLTNLTEKEMKRWLDMQVPVYNSVFNLRSKNNTLLLTKGAFLPLIEEDFKIGDNTYGFHSSLEKIPSSIEQIALSYLKAPYLWGGRTNFGIDCSGFTQMVYRFRDYTLPRDAYQQAEDGREVDFSEVQEGDLAFFAKDGGKITHVGIVLKNQAIIHAHGEVRVDLLTKEGIYNEEKQLLSHKLCLIKRYI